MSSPAEKTVQLNRSYSTTSQNYRPIRGLPNDKINGSKYFGGYNRSYFTYTEQDRRVKRKIDPKDEKYMLLNERYVKKFLRRNPEVNFTSEVDILNDDTEVFMHVEFMSTNLIDYKIKQIEEKCINDVKVCRFCDRKLLFNDYIGHIQRHHPNEHMPMQCSLCGKNAILTMTHILEARPIFCNRCHVNATEQQSPMNDGQTLLINKAWSLSTSEDLPDFSLNPGEVLPKIFEVSSLNPAVVSSAEFKDTKEFIHQEKSIV